MTQRTFISAILFTLLNLACASHSGAPRATTTGGKPPEFPVGAHAWGGGGGTMLRDDGTLERFASVAAGEGKKVIVNTSTDNGKTWSEPKDVGLSLKGTDWGGPGGLRDRNGELQFFFIRERRIGEGGRDTMMRRSPGRWMMSW